VCVVCLCLRECVWMDVVLGYAYGVVLVCDVGMYMCMWECGSSVCGAEVVMRGMCLRWLGVEVCVVRGSCVC